jgi:hypothetical protein
MSYSESFNILDWILKILPLFSVKAENERDSSNIRVTVQNCGFRTLHLIDLCICDEKKNVLSCIVGGSASKLSWDRNFKFPKSLTRDEPCSCVIYLPITAGFVRDRQRPLHIKVKATISTEKSKFSKTVKID